MTHTHRLSTLLAAGGAVLFSACASKSGTVTQESAGAVASAASSDMGSAPSALSGALGPASALISVQAIPVQAKDQDP